MTGESENMNFYNIKRGFEWQHFKVVDTFSLLAEN